jgi:hypothetical protein
MAMTATEAAVNFGEASARTTNDASRKPPMAERVCERMRLARHTVSRT